MSWQACIREYPSVDFQWPDGLQKQLLVSKTGTLVEDNLEEVTNDFF